jgi:hypothetical protein
MLGREPTGSEYTAAHRAARLLAQRGLVRARLQGRVLVLVKVPGAEQVAVRKVRDGDGGSGTDAGVGLYDVVGRAWQAFAADPGYAEAMCAAAVKLMSKAERTALTARRVGDADGGTGTEAQPALGVLAVGLSCVPGEPNCSRVVDPVAAWLEGEPGADWSVRLAVRAAGPV